MHAAPLKIKQAMLCAYKQLTSSKISTSPCCQIVYVFSFAVEAAAVLAPGTLVEFWEGGATLVILNSKNLEKMAVVRPMDYYSGGNGNPTRTPYIQHTYIHACMHTYIHTYIHSYLPAATKLNPGHIIQAFGTFLGALKL